MTTAPSRSNLLTQSHSGRLLERQKKVFSFFFPFFSFCLGLSWFFLFVWGLWVHHEDRSKARGRVGLARAEEGAEGDEAVLNGANLAVALLQLGVGHVRRALELERRAVRAERVAELLLLVRRAPAGEERRTSARGGGPEEERALFPTPALHVACGRAGETHGAVGARGTAKRGEATEGGGERQATDTAPERAGGEDGGRRSQLRGGLVAETALGDGVHRAVCQVVTARRTRAPVGVDEHAELTAGVEAVGESGGRGEEGGGDGGRRSERRHLVC